MTRISRFPVENQVLEKLYLLMFEVIMDIDEEEKFTKIINELLSPTEKIMIAKRVAIIYLLMKKIDYVTISQILKVSSSTVSKFSSTLNREAAIKDSLNEIVFSEKIKDFFETLYLDLRGSGTYGVNWESAWKQKIELEKRKRRGI